MTSTIKKKLVGVALMTLCVGGIVTTNYIDYKQKEEYENTISEGEKKLSSLEKDVEKLNSQNEELKSDISDQNKMLLKRDDDLKNKHNRILLVKNIKNERIEYLKKELKKKPKVVYKTEYKEKIVYKKSNGNNKVKTPVVAVVEKSTPKVESKKEVTQVSNETDTSLTTNTKSTESVGASFQMTSYTADCAGCTGVTATGLNVKGTTTHNGMNIIAVDPSVIPLGSTVRVTTSSGSFLATAQDTGGAIKGNIIDLLVGSSSQAQSNGRQNVKVQILR